MTRVRTVREWTANASLRFETDRLYWQGFRAGMVVALVLVILAALGYLVLA